MLAITADVPPAEATYCIQYSHAAYQEANSDDLGKLQQYLELTGSAVRLSDVTLESLIYKTSQIVPKWLSAVQGRIQKSIISQGDIESDGQSLPTEVAEAGLDFFSQVGDLVPGEPFIYSSQQGDLVAEFKGKRGPLTAIVSPEFVMLFAVVDGEPKEARASSPTELREAVEKVTSLLSARPHGALEAVK